MFTAVLLLGDRSDVTVEEGPWNTTEVGEIVELARIRERSVLSDSTSAASLATWSLLRPELG